MYFQVDINLFQIIPSPHEDLAAHVSFLGGQAFCTAVKEYTPVFETEDLD